MPAHVPSLTTEAELLAAYINQQLDGIRCAAYGLTDQQATSRSTVSALTIASLCSHAVSATGGWLDRVEAAPNPVEPDATPEQAAERFRAEWQPTGSLADLVAAIETLKGRVARVCNQVDLTAAVPVPTDAPWWPRDVQSWQVRWVLLHLVEELARHAGHADLIRESLDGATMYALKGAVEGWPATDWFTPWAPATTGDQAAE